MVPFQTLAINQRNLISTKDCPTEQLKFVEVGRKELDRLKAALPDARLLMLTIHYLGDQLWISRLKPDCIEGSLFKMIRSPVHFAQQL